MKKILFLCFLLQHILYASGQNIRTISIETENARPLNLSEIAEKVIPIPLEDQDIIQNQNILLTNEFLFVTSIYSIIQYDLSGKFIRRIDCGGYISDNVTCDPDKRKLYVPVRDKIKCYDYFGQLEKEYSSKTTDTPSFYLHCLYHKGDLWTQSVHFQPDKNHVYTINKINLTTGEITTLPYKKKVEPVRLDKDITVNVTSICRLSLYNDDVIASFDCDPAIYKIRQDKVVPLNSDDKLTVEFKQDKVIPLVKWDIRPFAQGNDVWPMKANSFIGEYLFINYRRDNQFYFYLGNMKTGKKYNVSLLIDDVFHTTGNCNINSMNQEGCFVFIKGQDEIKGDSIGNVPLKSGPVVFIAKIK